MKSIFRTVLALALVLLFAGCISTNQDIIFEIPHDGALLSGPYIKYYYDGEVAVNVVDAHYLDMPVLSVGVRINGDVPVKVYGQDQPEVEKYHSLCIKHSDTSYEGLDPYYDNPAKQCFARDLSSIEFVCDRDFDTAHPAGTSLLDKMNYSASSLSRWIRNGYRLDTFQKECFIIDKKADTLEADDLSLLCYFNMFQLQFTTSPAQPGSYEFTLTLTYDNGDVQTLNATVVF